MRPPFPPGVARILAGTALVLAVVALAAGPAAAHAVLLRSDPSPQTTAPAPPAAVRLVFSEPVEVAFGAVRVYDVEGRRVDEGKMSTAAGRREIVVPARLAGGTYSVTWRVVSTDGHAIRGGFQFYVGAPSTISPVVVEADSGPGAVVTWGYGAVRYLWYAALVGAIGLVVMRRFVWAPAVRAAGLGDSAAATRFRRGFNRTLPWSWALLVVAWLLRLVFQAATVSGLGLADAARPGVLGEMLGTEFGRSWLAGLGFTLLAGPPVAGLTRSTDLFGVRPQTWLSLLGAAAAGLALAAANMGHASTEGNPALGVPSAALHLLAVSTWMGGLAAIVLLGPSAWSAVPQEDRARLVGQVVGRFSRLALAAVAVLVVTGTVNSILDLASVTDLWRTTYGRVLSTKVALLTVALAFGAWHLWGVPRRLSAGDPVGTGRSFHRSSAAELVVLAAVVGFASALVALVPGRSLALATRGPVNQDERIGTYTVQLFIDPSSPGPNEIHVTFVDANGFGAAEVTSVTATLGSDGEAAGNPTPVPLRLLSAGHFVGEQDLAAGRYRLVVEAGGLSPPLSATFEFRLRARSAGGG